VCTGKATHALWDRLIFTKIKRSLGFERLKLMVTGSAPVAGHVLTFMRILLVCSHDQILYMSLTCTPLCSVLSHHKQRCSVDLSQASCSFNYQCYNPIASSTAISTATTVTTVVCVDVH
jgi:hypothetical protein